MEVITPDIDLGNSKLRNKVLITLSVLLIIACIATGTRNFVVASEGLISGSLPVAISQYVFAFLFGFITYKISKDQTRPWFDWFVVYSYLGLILFAVISFGIEKNVVKWLYSIPVVSFFILSRQHGLLLSLAVALLMAYLHIDYNLTELGVAWNIGINNLLLPYVIVLGVSYAYERARQQKELELTEFALTDPLTNSYNRLALRSMISSYQKSSEEYSLLLLDIDHFKRVNDLYGHDAGDQILIAFAQFFQAELGCHQVFRIGGEEFTLLLSGTGEESFIRAESLRKKIENHEFFYGDKRIYLTFSAGLAQGIKNKDLSELLKQADTFLYRAKALGRNRTVYQNSGS